MKGLLVKTRNPIAKDVRTVKYAIRIVKAKKGKGSYSRKEKHSGIAH